MKKVRIAGLGGWHIHAKDFTDRIHEDAHSEVAAIWDNNPERGLTWAAQYGCPFYENLDQILKDPTIDAVTITCETTMHYEIIIRAAKAGKHIYVEKPPFVSASEAADARNIILENQVLFMYGSPIVKPMHLKIQELIQDGKLGDIVSIRYRTVHENGLLKILDPSFYEKDNNGGGAMMDMGNHALHLLSWFAGEPIQSKAIYTSNMPLAKKNAVDDNDIAVMEFANGVLGIIETGWISPWYQYGFDIYGTKGAASCRAYELFVCMEDGIWRKIPESQYPDAEQYPLHYWIDCIRLNRPILRDNIDVAELVTRMSEGMQAASQKQLEQNTVETPLPLPNHWMQRVQTAKKYALSGKLGQLQNIRVRCCGTKKDINYTAQAQKIAEFFFGAALGKKQIESHQHPAEAVLLLFADNKLGIAEAGYQEPESNFSIDICGSHGWLRIRGDSISYTDTEAGNRNATWKTINIDNQEG